MRYPIAASIVLTLLAVQGLRAQEADDAEHQALRQILKGATEAINQGKYADLAPFFHENMHATTINQETITSRDQIAPYFAKWFGEGKKIKSLNMTLEPDAKTTFYGEKNNLGIVHGSGIEKYILNDGRAFDFKIRWTATMLKDDGGKWRILTIHLGTNFLDNPLLNAIEGSVTYYAAGGAAGGVVLTALMALVLGRRRKTEDSPAA